VLAGSGSLLLVQLPELAVVGVAVVGASLVTIALALAGHPKSVVVSLVEVAQAIALVPAAAIIAGTLDEPSTTRATIAAGLYLVGSVLLVRSMIRARGNAWFLAASIGFHAIGVVAAAWLLPWPFAFFAAGLLGRAIALPVIQHGGRRGPPVRDHIGLVRSRRRALVHWRSARASDR
jgi:hypothetical protein